MLIITDLSVHIIIIDLFFVVCKDWFLVMME